MPNLDTPEARAEANMVLCACLQFAYRNYDLLLQEIAEQSGGDICPTHAGIYLEHIKGMLTGAQALVRQDLNQALEDKFNQPFQGDSHHE